MAETLKPGDGQKSDLTGLKRWITDIVRQKSEAKEWNGKAAQATAQAVESTGLDKAAITLVASLERKEPAKRTTIVTDIMAAFSAMGWIEEDTLFGTPKQQAAETVSTKGGKGKKGSGATGADIQKALDQEAAAATTNVVPMNPAKPVDEFDAAAPPAPPAPPITATVQ